MKTTDSSSRINSVSVVEIDMKLAGSATELDLETSVALLNNKQPGVLGKSKYGGPWPEEVTSAVRALQAAIENHLLGVYFEVGDDTGRAVGTAGSAGAAGPAGRRKQGIVEPAMERSDDEPPQL